MAPSFRNIGRVGPGLGMVVGAGLLVAACSTTPDAPGSGGTPTPDKRTVSWPATPETKAELGVDRWSVIAPDADTVEVVGHGEKETHVTLRRIAASDDEPAHHILEVPGGAIRFRGDGTSPDFDVTDARWEAILLASIVDRATEQSTGSSAEAPSAPDANDGLLGQSLHPRIVPIAPPATGGGSGTSGGLVGAAGRLLDGCGAASGEGAYFAATQAALGCAPTPDGPRSARVGASPMIQTAAFDATAARCSAGSASVARAAGSPSDVPCSDGGVQLVGWGADLLRSACLVGAAGVAAGLGMGTYWVCTTGAVVIAGGACTVVAPGVGTVACGAGAAVGAQPVCLGGGGAVLAGSAAAGLAVCNAVAPGSGTDAQPQAPTRPTTGNNNDPGCTPGEERRDSSECHWTYDYSRSDRPRIRAGRISVERCDVGDRGRTRWNLIRWDRC